MKEEGLRNARVVQGASATVAALAGLAGVGLALTDYVFADSGGPPATRTTTPTPTTTTDGPVTAASSTGWWTILAIAFGLALVLVAVSGAIALRRRRLRRQVDREVASVVQTGSSVASVTQTVLEAQSAPAQEGKLVRQRAGRHLVDTHARAALGVDFLYLLPQRPRSVKRAVNDLLLRIALAVQSDLLSERSALQPSALAKWVVLRHRWPELAAAIEDRPALLAELESAKDEESLDAALRRANVATGDLHDVFALVGHEPRLAPVLRALTYFEPAKR